MGSQRVGHDRATNTLTISDKSKNSTRSQDSFLSRLTSQPGFSCSSLPRVSLIPPQSPSLSRGRNGPLQASPESRGRTRTEPSSLCSGETWVTAADTPLAEAVTWPHLTQRMNTHPPAEPPRGRRLMDGRWAPQRLEATTTTRKSDRGSPNEAPSSSLQRQLIKIQDTWWWICRNLNQTLIFLMEKSVQRHSLSNLPVLPATLSPQKGLQEESVVSPADNNQRGTLGNLLRGHSGHLVVVNEHAQFWGHLGKAIRALSWRGGSQEADPEQEAQPLERGRGCSEEQGWGEMAGGQRQRPPRVFMWPQSQDPNTG